MPIAERAGAGRRRIRHARDSRRSTRSPRRTSTPSASPFPRGTMRAVGCRLLECRASTCWSKSPWPLRSTKPTHLIACRRTRAAAFCRSATWSASIPPSLAVQPIVSRPMFFEVHRLGIFTPRSLDVDVVYDVMIHDLDILLSLVECAGHRSESRGHSGDHR